MKLYTKSRDNLYEATAEYDGKIVIVKKGSIINLRNSKGFNPSSEIKSLREDTKLFDEMVLIKDVSFTTLSAAASFVTGRVANGMIVWKTADGKYVRFSLNRRVKKDGN